MVSLDLKEAYLQVPIHPEGPRVLEVCGLRQGVSISRPLLRPHHRFSPGLWLLYPRFSMVWVFAFISMWVIGSFRLHRGRQSSALSRLSSRSGHSCESGEIQLCSGPASPVSGNYNRFCVFQGFSFPAESREASLNRRRISVLQAAARFFLAGSPRRSLPSSSGQPPLHAVTPTDPPSLMGQSGHLYSDPMGRSLP